MTHNYKYLSFGLKIQSEFSIPELKSSDFPNADVLIRYGLNPENLVGIKSQGALYQAKENDFLFKLNAVGSFRVQSGNMITVEPDRNTTDEEVRLFLLGSAFGALLQQRDLFTFHGSTVIKNNNAYVIGGKSGTGKSSLAATLLNSGFQLLADDISVIKIINDIPVVFPGIPHLKLWADVMEALKEDLQSYPIVRPQILKYRKPVPQEFSNTPKNLEAITVLNTKNTIGFEIEKLRGYKKFEILKENTYRYRFLEGLDKTTEHFQTATSLSSLSRIFLLKRPSAPLRLHELAHFFIREVVEN